MKQPPANHSLSSSDKNVRCHRDGAGAPCSVVMGDSLHNGLPHGKVPRLRRLADAQPDDTFQCRVALPASTLARIHAIKQRGCVRTRDAAIAGLIRLARTHFVATDFDLPPAPDPDDDIVSISLSLEAGHVAFLYTLQRRFRGCALGATLEAVVETVGDLSPRPVQLDFFSATLVS